MVRSGVRGWLTSISTKFFTGKRHVCRLLIAGAAGMVLSVLMVTSATAGTGIISRVSTDVNGAQGNNRSYGSISADGRYVVFSSTASNLVPVDTNSSEDVFIKDTQSGAITLLSNDSFGVQGNYHSNYPSISADGRYVAFSSDASNLVSGDSNGFTDIFVRDTLMNTITRVSTVSLGAQANGGSNYPSISADGRYVTFSSGAANLVPGDGNVAWDIFIKDTQTDTTTMASTAFGGPQGNNPSNYPSISADGRYVAFSSSATNLVSGDGNGFTDVFVKNTLTGAITRVSTASGGTEGDAASSNGDMPSISADGRYVAFSSSATNLVSGDSNNNSDVFVKDTLTNNTTRISTASGGAQANSSSQSPTISADGNYVAFDSAANNLVSGDGNSLPDVFVKDVRTGVTTRVSIASGGAEGTGGYSFRPSISADGRYVVFSSTASGCRRQQQRG